MNTITVHRGFRFRLYPTPEQAARFEQIAGVCRFVYNVALEQRETWWRQYRANTGRYISFPSQCRELTQLRAEVDWIGAVPRVCQEQALRDLDEAFQRFFQGHSSHPQYHCKGVHEGFRFKGSETRIARLNGRWSTVRVTGIDPVKFRRSREMAGNIREVTIYRLAGRWFVSFVLKMDQPVRAPLPSSVGIDRGITRTITLSTGAHISVPASLAAIERRQRKARRRLSRKVRGSARYQRQRQRVAAMSARCARIRKDWCHRVTTDIARRFGTVVVEDLNIKGMTASGPHKRGLNRSIANQGWGIFEALLKYKLAERGGALIFVPAAYTSQTCSACGTIDRNSRESQASFACRHCGHTAHADENAAINILRASSPGLLRVEATEYGAVEARTTNHALA